MRGENNPRDAVTVRTAEPGGGGSRIALWNGWRRDANETNDDGSDDGFGDGADEWLSD